MKTFMCDYHLNDPTTFLHFQIEVYSTHARILALGYNNAFSVFHVHGLVIFQHRAQIQKLLRSPVECMKTDMSKFASQRQQSPLILGTRKSSFLSDQRHLTMYDRRHGRYHPHALFCGSRLTFLKKMYRDTGRFIFHGVSMFKDRGHRAVC